MSIKGNNFLKQTLGEDFFESLAKAELWKPGTKTVIDPQEIATALQIVPRTLMAILIRELSPMEIGETREIHLPVPTVPATMNVTKHERDVYSGDIKQDNKILVDFKYRSLPGLGLVIMSAFELYSVEELTKTPDEPKHSDIDQKIQKMIDERLHLHELINKVVDNKLMQREAVQQIAMARLTEELAVSKKRSETISELTKISKQQSMSDPYFHGMANAMVVADSVVNEKEPEFVEPPSKKISPLKGFLDKRKNKKEYSIQMSKGENVNCPDCNKNIFDGKLFSGCICLGDDREKKVFIKKAEGGYSVRFSKGWDEENIEMLLEVLRRKNG